jgi:hypothetical protein
MTTPKTIEETHLSDGRLLNIRKMGRRHTVMLGGLAFDEAPTLHFDLLKADAYKVYADYLEADVMECM